MPGLKHALAALFAISAAAGFAATTITVTDLPSPNGPVRVSIHRPEAPRANLIFVGGGGGVPDIQMDGDGRNPLFYVDIAYRSRQHFLDRGYSFIRFDSPAYLYPNGMSFDYRASASTPPIIQSVLDLVRRKDDIPTWVLGHSAGAISTVNGGLNLPTQIPFGLVLDSPTSFDGWNRPPQTTVLEMNLEGIKRPTFVITHALDYCVGSLPTNSRIVASRLTGAPAAAHVELTGGADAPGDECGATGYHAFGGLEEQFVAAIVDWTTKNAHLAQTPNYTALWWNPAENGWGINFTHQGNTLFGTLFTYDATRAPLWLVFSNGVMQSDGVTYTGDLHRTTGPAFNANPFTPIGASNYTLVGTMTVKFANASSGTLSYTVNGVPVTKSIQRLVYGTRAANCAPTTAARTASTNFQDLWWNAAESGWGVNVTHQDNTLFATLFTYDATGRDLWLVMSGGVRQSDGTYLGTLYKPSGPPFNANPFTPITEADLTNVGTMRFQFADGERGTLNYTVNGVAVSKAITRLVFASPVPACN